MQRSAVNGAKPTDDLYSCFPEPDPDYINDDDDDNADSAASDFPPPPPAFTAEELSAAVSEAYDLHVNNGTSMTLDDTSSADPPLIKPKPLLNPCLESKERLALHRELLMNYRIGKDVLQKPELNKVLRDRREKEKKKEWEELKSSKGRTSLVIKLEERANRLKEEEEKKTKVTTEEKEAPELARIHRKITQKSGGSEQP